MSTDDDDQRSDISKHQQAANGVFAYLLHKFCTFVAVCMRDCVRGVSLRSTDYIIIIIIIRQRRRWTMDDGRRGHNTPLTHALCTYFL